MKKEIDKIKLIIKDCKEYLKAYGEAFITEEELNIIENRIKELVEENKKLKIVSAENTYGNENTHFITKRDLARIDTNKYLIEIKEGKFVDAKQLYLDSLNSIPKQKVKDILQNNRNELFSTTYIDDKQYKPYTMQIDRINKIEKELFEEGD